MKSSVWRVAVTGPECTGKSEIAQALALHFNTVWVPEYAREFIDGLEKPYTYKDILTIAKRQVEFENKMLKSAERILFADTELLVCKIWCEFKFGRCHSWILKQLKNQVYDLYLLMDVDLPWQRDPQREHPDKRIELFELYLAELRNYGFPFEIVKGIGKLRLMNAIDCIRRNLEIT
jgi:NadR type nicotinamide-nucleotide adenylyltransferase